LKVTQVFDSMAEGKLPFGEGASINRPPLFMLLTINFWKFGWRYCFWRVPSYFDFKSK